MATEFTADVRFSDWSRETPSRMQVSVDDDDGASFAGEDATRTIALEDVFDIREDFPTEPSAKGKVTIGFNAASERTAASVATNPDSLVRFQRALFERLLGGTTCAVRGRSSNDPRAPTRDGYTLSVTASTISLRAGRESEDNIVIPRGEISQFKTAREAFAGQSDQPTVSIYSTTDEGSYRTTIRLPSFRLLNLFGRYLRSTLSVDTARSDSTGSGQISVLLVDDEPDHLEFTKLFLRRHSLRFDVTTAESAAEGLGLLGDGAEFDCVVSDFSMPEHDGIEFLRAVRERYPDLPFILYTGQGTREVVRQAILDDVTDYVEKHDGTQQYRVLAESIMKTVD